MCAETHIPTGTSFIPQERPQQSLLGAIRVSLKLQVGLERHVYSKLEQKPPDKRSYFPGSSISPKDLKNGSFHIGKNQSSNTYELGDAVNATGYIPGPPGYVCLPHPLSEVFP